MLALDPAQVGARAEMSAGAREYEHASVAGLVDGVGEVPDRVDVKGVAALGAIDGEKGDVAAALSVDHRVRRRR